MCRRSWEVEAPLDCFSMSDIDSHFNLLFAILTCRPFLDGLLPFADWFPTFPVLVEEKTTTGKTRWYGQGYVMTQDQTLWTQHHDTDEHNQTAKRSKVMAIRGMRLVTMRMLAMVEVLLVMLPIRTDAFWSSQEECSPYTIDHNNSPSSNSHLHGSSWYLDGTTDLHYNPTRSIHGRYTTQAVSCVFRFYPQQDRVCGPRGDALDILCILHGLFVGKYRRAEEWP